MLFSPVGQLLAANIRKNFPTHTFQANMVNGEPFTNITTVDF